MARADLQSRRVVTVPWTFLAIMRTDALFVTVTSLAATTPTALFSMTAAAADTERGEQE
jgi:hypothetical protein